MLNQNKLQELLGEDPNKEVSPEEDKFNREALARLATNEVLRRALRISMKSRLITALDLLSQREFEKAFATMESFTAIEEIDTMFEDAKNQPTSITKTTDKNARIKY